MFLFQLYCSNTLITLPHAIHCSTNFMNLALSGLISDNTDRKYRRSYELEYLYEIIISASSP